MKILNERELQQIASNHSTDIEFKDFIKLYKDYKDYTREQFLVNDTTLSLDNPLRLERTYYKMTLSDKIKTIDDKIQRNKAQFYLDRNC